MVWVCRIEIQVYSWTKISLIYWKSKINSTWRTVWVPLRLEKHEPAVFLFPSCQIHSAQCPYRFCPRVKWCFYVYTNPLCNKLLHHTSASAYDKYLLEQPQNHWFMESFCFNIGKRHFCSLLLLLDSGLLVIKMPKMWGLQKQLAPLPFSQARAGVRSCCWIRGEQKQLLEQSLASTYL